MLLQLAHFETQLRNICMHAHSRKLLFLRLACQKRFFLGSQGNPLYVLRAAAPCDSVNRQANNEGGWNIENERKRKVRKD